MIFYGENGAIYDWVSEVDVKSPATKYPIWLMVMSSEACRGGQAIWILERLSIPKRSLCEFKTDSIAFTPTKRKREAIKKVISDLRYCDLHAMKDTFMPVTKKQRRLDDSIPLIPIASDEQVLQNPRHGGQGQDGVQTRAPAAKTMGSVAPFVGMD